MSYQFARIDLAQTDYEPCVDWKYIDKTDTEILNRLQQIYKTYCIYKRYASVMPFFNAKFQDPMSDVIGYYDNQQLVAWSLIRKFDEHNALCDQFAWTYHRPKLRLGIETLKTECAIYKSKGFKFLYLEQAHLYKKEIKGFELLGPMT